MEDTIINQLEVAPHSVVLQAASDFAKTLAETSQYKAFESATELLRADTQAQETANAYQLKHQSLRGVIMLNAVNKEDRDELEQLKDSYLKRSSVIQYNQAQSNLIVLCQEVGDILSQSIGFDFPAAGKKGGGCC